jgi:hypothetical protein
VVSRLHRELRNRFGENAMYRSARKWVLVATLLLVPVTIVCDVPGLERVVESFDAEVYYDDYYYDRHYDDDHSYDCWFPCDDEWFFDFDWWW